MSERVFERVNLRDGAFFVAGFAATGHWRRAFSAAGDLSHHPMVRQ